MKTFKIILIFIFCFLTCQLFADDKGSGSTTQKPKTIDIKVINLPEYPLERTILPSFSGELYVDYISLEANFPVGEVAVQIVNAANQIVWEETVYFEGEAVRIDMGSLVQGEYQLLLKVGSTNYKGVFQMD